MARDFTIDTTGMRELRRDLKRLDPALDRELQRELRGAVGDVAEEARALAPRRTGALGRSYKPFARIGTTGVRSRLSYAPVHEYGGTIQPRGAPITIPRSAPVTRAVDKQTDEIIDSVGDAVDRAAKRAGWR